VILDPPGFLREASQAEHWSVLDERRCMIQSRLLADLEARSLSLSRNAQGERFLTADAGRPVSDQAVRLSELDPKATLTALSRLVLQLDARERARLFARG
jgi:hypothetical protein